MVMSLQSLEKYYHEVCHNYSSHSAISAIVSGKGSWRQLACMYVHVLSLESSVTLLL